MIVLHLYPTEFCYISSGGNHEAVKRRRAWKNVGELGGWVGWLAWVTLVETKITMEIPSLPGTLNNHFLMDGNG